MSDNKKYYWLKLKDDFFTLTTTKLLRNMPEGDLLTIIYLKLQLLSLKNNGNLIHHRLLPNLVDELAIAIDEKPQFVELTLRTLEKLHLIESISNDEYLLTAMNELIGAETKSAVEKRAYRNKVRQIEDKKQTLIGQCPTEIETEIEIEKIKSKNVTKKSTTLKKEIQGEDLASRFNSILDKFNREQGGMNDIPMNAQERAKFVTWLAQRVIDHPKLKNTDRALLNQITRMRDFEDPRDADSVNSILDDTIRGNDKGVFQNILEPKKKVVRPRSLADEGLHF